MKKNRLSPYAVSSLIVMFVMLLALVALFVYGVFVPRVTESDYDRNLKEKPEFTIASFLSGDYADGITNWFTDTIHGRDDFKDLAAQLRLLYGIQQEETTFGNTTTLLDDASSESETEIPDLTDSDVTDSDAASSEPASEPENTEEEDENDGVGDEEMINEMLLYKTRAMELYYGDLNQGDAYAEYVNAYAEKFPDVNVYSMIIPKACAYYLKGTSYASVADRTPLNIDNINEQLKNVTPVDAYNALKEHTDEDIYMRTDHHWSSLGAYYAAQEFAKTAGTGFADLSEYTEYVREGYVGTMYKFMNNNAVLLNNPENFVTYIPNNSYTATFYTNSMTDPFEHDIFFKYGDNAVSSWYMTFINGDSYITHIHSDACSNGRTLLLIKDSYGNALAPYFLKSFEDVWIMDMRTVEVPVADFIEEHDITDLLFAMCSQSSTNKAINKYIGTIMYQE